MIYIFDDTFDERSRYNDISYLLEDDYKSVVNIFKRPSIEDLKNTIDSVTQDDIACIHRSLAFYKNDIEIDSKIIDKNKIRESFIDQLKEYNCKVIVFGRDVFSNPDRLMIDKNKFYTNLRAFLDSVIMNNGSEIKILYYGNDNYIVDRLNIANNLINIINESKDDDYYGNEIVECLMKLFTISPEEAKNIVSYWKNNNYNKSNIIQDINGRI